MKQTNPKSRLEIWGTRYINDPDERYDNDKRAKAIQIESTDKGDNYIVEVIGPENKEATPDA